MDHNDFQVAFWLVSICFAIFGLGVTIVGWRVNAKNALSLAKKKDIHEAVDTCIEALIELEDSAYSYWLASDTEKRPYQLIVSHARLTHRLKQLQDLSKQPIPSSDLITLRRYCTMDAESKTVPLNSEDVRIKHISKAATSILHSSILQKNWEKTASSA
ncbi:hypothetical protein [Pseudomonas viridiflava]|uniref:hypothetical protein n=1 Tax=Pseudomonas viridiflava TaxID=33069 RepID=UPI000F014B62|nr:hypothetical protein [Pseudomonas viridiflava]MEE4140056.1 hypothetical protein [Pseudomonas viridiflava]